MAREYRIELGDNINRQTALEILGGSPYFHRPAHPFQEGEVWLSMKAGSDFPEVRLFPRPYGFFLEITNLPHELFTALGAWIIQLRNLGDLSVIDDDTGEVAEVVR